MDPSSSSYILLVSRVFVVVLVLVFGYKYGGNGMAEFMWEKRARK